jgi:hypothetical protein
MSKIHSRVYGSVSDNPDGSNRQWNIQKYCSAGKKLILIPEHDNEFDKYAIGVWVESRFLLVKTGLHQIGYINADLSEELNNHMTSKGRVSARINEVTGGSGAKTNIGVNILIEKY